MNSGAIIVLLAVVFIFSSLGGKVDVSRGPTGKNPTGIYQTYKPSGTISTDLKNFAQSYGDWVTDEDANQVSQSILKYGEKYQVDPKLVAAVIARESRFNKMAVSSSGAQGLGQMLPATAMSLGVQDPFDIDQNVMGTTRYIRSMLDRWSAGDNQVALALASYKEGPNAVKRNNGNYSDGTARYIDDIMKIYDKI
ncbi:MAG: lytic transglycosylase domain-containing protein [bacterium]